MAANIAAAEWTVLPERSAVTMYAMKQGQWFNGTFDKFTASIEFDEDNPVAGSIVGVVRTASIETNDDQNNTYVTGYLNAEEFPEAHFASTGIERTEEGFRAMGELELAGHDGQAVLDFTFATETSPSTPATRATFTGTMTINRFEYDIASDLDTNAAGQDVIVQVVLDLVQ